MRTAPVRRLTLLLALGVAVLAGTVVPSAAAVSGELRVLYVLATWGPAPFSHADAESVAAETDAFFRASSSGRLSLPSSVVDLRLPRAVFDGCDATVLRNAAPSATFDDADRVVFVTPSVPACQFHGEANPTEVLLNGHLSMPLAAHELGHTLGLGHASRWHCAAGACTVDEYGSEFSVMGLGGGDLNAFEKEKLQWLTGVVRPTGNGTFEIGPVDEATTLPQALVVTTAGGEFWFESRGRETASWSGGPGQPPGIAVVAGPGNGAVRSPYPRENLLLAPGGGGRQAFAAGESFVRPGVFRVHVERHVRESSALRFEWLDRAAPGRPSVTVSATRRGRARVTWDPAQDLGSGVRAYTLLVDRRAVRTFDGQIPYLNASAQLRLARGFHRIGVLATDRAGNRGPSTSVRVRVR